MGDPDPPSPLSRTIEASPLAQTIGHVDGRIDEHIDGRIAGHVDGHIAGPSAGRSQTTTRVDVKAAPGPREISGDTLTTAGTPQRIGRYLVLRVLGEGGMGVVYAGYDEELDRKVAIKLLHPAQQGDSQLRARIIREAQSLARVSAPNVVHVYEVGEFAGQLFIVMEFVSGTTLTRWQAEKGRHWKEILRMYCAAGHGLLEAHAAGLVHREL